LSAERKFPWGFAREKVLSLWQRTELCSTSRRPPDVEDYIDMLRRYRSWLIGPMFAGLVIAVVVGFFLAGYLRFPGDHAHHAAADFRPARAECIEHADPAAAGMMRRRF
jgi:hypothetical protein